MLEWGHLRFLREYEYACKILELPQDQIIITISDYNRIKKSVYDKWLLEVEKKGFPIRGLTTKLLNFFGFRKNFLY
jgi:hypothetical protein